MGKKTLKCIICGVGTRDVPDRENPGKHFAKKVCRKCHADRLRQDLKAVLAHHESVNR